MKVKITYKVLTTLGHSRDCSLTVDNLDDNFSLHDIIKSRRYHRTSTGYIPEKHVVEVQNINTIDL